ncbi:MAG: hypothetical protein RLN79_10525 [Cytophagales bacterium]
MDKNPQSKSDNVNNWLKNLAQESWQLELLVSAFTIFLLLAAQDEFGKFIASLPIKYDLKSPVFALIYIFLGSLGFSLKILVFSLVTHLLLRGFWIGTIGLRSVQDHVDWEKMNYSSFFTERLKKRVRKLDDLVILLDDICSVLFSFSFLLISILLAFALSIVILGLSAAFFQILLDKVDGLIASVLVIFMNVILFSYIILGLIYLIDFFSLGIFKKNEKISKFYYPVYKFFGYITLSFISRSIYYHLISRFTKKRIRLIYLFIILIIIISSLVDIDHNYFFSRGNQEIQVYSSYYDEFRKEKTDFIEYVSVPSLELKSKYVPLFIPYNPDDNQVLDKTCPDIASEISKMLDWNISFSRTDKLNIEIAPVENADNLAVRKLDCLCSIYRVSLNEKKLTDLNFYFHQHHITGQKGIMAMLSAELFKNGENHIKINKANLQSDSIIIIPIASIKIWK